jgi:hypothetical protein
MLTPRSSEMLVSYNHNTQRHNPEYHVLYNYTQETHSSECNSHSVGQEIPHLLCNPKFHYRVHITTARHWFLSEVRCIQSKPPRHTSPTPTHSFLAVPHIFLSTLFSKTLHLCSSLTVRDQVSHHTKQQAKLWFCIY